MDPMSIAIALGLMLAGTYARKKSQEDIEGQQRRVLEAERQRQGMLEEQRANAVAQALPQFTKPAQEAEQQSIAQRVQQYLDPQVQTTATTGDYSSATNPGAPKEIKDREAAAHDAAMRKGRDYASRLSDLSSINLLNFNSGVGLNRLGEKTGNLMTSAARSSQILPFELNSTYLAGQRNATLADTLNGAGSIAAMYGMSGPSAPAAGTPGGTGITIPPTEGYTGVFQTRPGGQGLNPNARAPGIRVPNLTYAGI